jgi:response regulator of citrate/malate metabolism
MSGPPGPAGPEGAEPIRTLVVEDDPIAAEAHAAYVCRVPGFAVVATAGTAAEAMRRLARGTAVDLVLLDMNLPDMHGLDLCRAMRGAGHRADVIAVTSARDLAVVRTAVSQGVVQYVLKPFAFATLRDRLERYAAYRAEVARDDAVAGQQEIDRMLGSLRTSGEDRLPKGLAPDLLEGVVSECPSGRRRALGGGGGGAARRLAGHRPAVPGAPDGRAPRRSRAAVRGCRPPGAGVPLAHLTAVARGARVRPAPERCRAGRPGRAGPRAGPSSRPTCRAARSRRGRPRAGS